MKQVFITPSGALRERWQQAFPDAGVQSSVEAIDKSPGGRGVLWLDSSSISHGQRMSAVDAAVAHGWPVVVMSAIPLESEAFQLLNRGAMGYCHLDAAPEQLREIAMVVEHGGFWMPPQLMRRFLALSTRVVPAPPAAARELNELTARELMVAEQVAHGASNREIAEALEITERTVKAHLSAIFEKLGVRDRVQLALAMNNIPTYATVN